MSLELSSQVIVISGSVGAGKSTIAALLSKALDDAPVLTFDHYEEFVQWPADMRQWMQDGADPSEIRVPRLKDDLLALLRGEAITYPLDDKVVQPAKYILLEEPSGRERDEIKELIDLVIYLDVPQDICVLRMIQRVLDMETWTLKGSFEQETPDDLARQLDAVATWSTQYERARSMYMDVSRRVKGHADILIDGMKPTSEITAEIVHAIRTSLLL